MSQPVPGSASVRGMADASGEGRTERRRALFILHGVFFISGFCALVYQTAWQRMLGLFVGSDTVSATIVVGAFLFGLGVGSLAAAGFADRLTHARAVIAFGLCEFGIALCAVVSPWLFHDVIAGRLQALAGSPVIVFTIVFAALLPPTLLMGLSLPVLARAVVREIEGAAERVSWLYGLNTLGAGLGALVAGLILIGTLGYEVTVYIGALLNLAVAIASLGVAGTLKARAFTSRPAVARAPRQEALGRSGLLGWAALLFSSGFLIISLEIVWFRVLGNIIWTMPYAFPLILAVFLIADAMGIVAGARVLRRFGHPLPFFLRLQGMVALYALGTMLLVWMLFAEPGLAALFIPPEAGRAVAEPRLSFLAWGAIACVVVGPPAFLLGMSFPIAQRAVQEDPAVVGRRVGLVQLANILGNTAGAVVTGLILLHLLGTAGTLRVVGLLGLALLLSIFMLNRRHRVLGPGMQRGGVRDLALAAALLALIVLFPANAAFWARLHGTVATEAHGGATVAEDRSGVVVIRPGGGHLWMYIGGHTQSRVPFYPIHGALGAIGPLVHPDPRSVLVVGHAMGSTPYAAALALGTGPGRFVRSVEIVAPVHEALHAHAARPDAVPVLAAIVSEPRIARVIGDGRHAIFSDPRRWDVIEADALQPRSSHSGLLYSIEFFRQVRDRLAPGGMAVQWEATPRTLASFLAAFPWVLRVDSGQPWSTILIGSADGPVRYDTAALAARLASVAPALEAAGWPPQTLRALLVDVTVQAWGPGDPRPQDVNTDLFPKDEYFLNRPVDLLRRSLAAP